MADLKAADQAISQQPQGNAGKQDQIEARLADLVAKKQHSQTCPHRRQQAAGEQDPFGDAPGVQLGLDLVDPVEGAGGQV